MAVLPFVIVTPIPVVPDVCRVTVPLEPEHVMPSIVSFVK